MRPGTFAIAFALVTSLPFPPAEARNDRSSQQIAVGLRGADRSVPVYFGSAGTGAQLSSIQGRGKSSVSGVTTEEACGKAFRDAVANLQVSARNAGGSSVGDIVSAHGRERSSSSTSYLCGVGNVQTSVILRGNIYGKR